MYTVRHRASDTFQPKTYTHTLQLRDRIRSTTGSFHPGSTNGFLDPRTGSANLDLYLDAVHRPSNPEAIYNEASNPSLAMLGHVNWNVECCSV